jgi:predicted small secreted protein
MKRCTTLIGSLAFIVAIGVSGALFAASSQTELMKEATISKSQAEKTVLGKVPNGVIKGEEIEREHGKLIWSFDIATSGTKNITEVQVDAKTGKIVSTQVETPKDQAKEAAADKKEKK